MVQLPSGTVTLLFTDIEGSTKLWQHYPDSMPEALARHHALLREAIETHAGYVFQIIGDAFCAAFHTAADGLAAALAAIRVRMAVHTGAAAVRAGEFTSGEYMSGTSREALGNAGETAYRVPSLSLPPIQSPISNFQSLTQYEAVRLFIDRALAVQPDFGVTNANAPAVAQICHRLDFACAGRNRACRREL